jgi:microcystin-dependent protein
MAQPYVGEVRMFAGNFAPAGWMFCEGQLIAISENETLFQLIGTTYGGDGQSTFALPDLRGRLPIHQGSAPGGSTYSMAESGGVEQVTLTTNQMPSHTHPMVASTTIANSSNPANAILATSSQVSMYFGGNTNTNMNTTAISSAGGNQPHTNIQPFLCVDFIISLYGIYPSPT